MHKINTLRELQLVEFSILQDLVEFCKTNDIRLVLNGGTLLGAVRHKGFIPWDDDIDVAMSRPDYEKLININNKQVGPRCIILDPETDKEFKGYVPLVVYKNSTLTSMQYRYPEKLFISLSIFVYDGVPKNKIKRFFYFKKMFYLRSCHALCRANFKNANTKLAKVFGPILSIFFKEKSVYKYKNKITNFEKKYSYTKSDIVAPTYDKDGYKEVTQKSKFEKTTTLVFEGLAVNSFCNYDEYLRMYYGNYLLPPKEKHRIPKHHFYGEVEDSFIFKEDVL